MSASDGQQEARRIVGAAATLAGGCALQPLPRSTHTSPISVACATTVSTLKQPCRILCRTWSRSHAADALAAGTQLGMVADSRRPEPATAAAVPAARLHDGDAGSTSEGGRGSCRERDGGSGSGRLPAAAGAAACTGWSDPSDDVVVIDCSVDMRRMLLAADADGGEKKDGMRGGVLLSLPVASSCVGGLGLSVP